MLNTIILEEIYVPKFQFDLTKIHNIGWKASYSSDDAVRETVKYIKNN